MARKQERRVMPWSEMHEALGEDTPVAFHRDTGHFGKQFGSPIYSVSTFRGGKPQYFGHATDVSVASPRVEIDRSHLEDSLNTGTKTRNTFISGFPSAMPSDEELGNATPLIVRRGTAGTPDAPTSILATPTESGLWTPRPRMTSAPRSGIVVPKTAPKRSHVFAQGVIASKHGLHMINPLDV